MKNRTKKLTALLVSGAASLAALSLSGMAAYAESGVNAAQITTSAVTGVTGGAAFAMGSASVYGIIDDIKDALENTWFLFLENVATGAHS